MNAYNTTIGTFGKKVSTYLAATATVAVIAVAASGIVSRAHADSHDDRNHNEMSDQTKAVLYDLDQMEVKFHLAGSYGGNIDAMMDLWADDCTFTSGGVVLTGKDAVRASFSAGGPFTHYWVGLTAAFKITSEPHGDTAEIYFECHYADPSATPYVLRADRNLYGTVKKVNGKWVFWRMFGDAAPL